MPEHTTKIEWTWVPGYKGDVWNPTTGCTRVSPGCDHCYAFALHDKRYLANKAGASEYGMPPAALRAQSRQPDYKHLAGALPYPAQYDLPFSTVQVLDDTRLNQPVRKSAPHAYFVDSMADLFHDDVPDAHLDRVFAVMATTPRHLYMILTKRPARMRDYLEKLYEGNAARLRGALPPGNWQLAMALPLANVWVGTSTEDQQRFDERWAELRGCIAAVRFISAEPLLGPIDLTEAMPDPPLQYASSRWQSCVCLEIDPSDVPCIVCECRGLDWVIVGGESGPGARGMDTQWVQAMYDQCRTSRVAFFGKQGSAYRSGQPIGHGLDVHEWPQIGVTA